MLDDAELARRAVKSSGELIAAIGLWGVGPEVVVRRPDAVGARIDADENPWFDAAFTPPGVAPPADAPDLPMCLWSVDAAAPGRIEDPEIATPCLGVDLTDPALSFDDAAPDVETPSLDVLGDVNERAYDDYGTFGPLVRRLRDPRIRTYGLRRGGAFVCVALTLTLDDDLGVHFMATAAEHRRQGLAGALLLAVLAEARREGLRSASLTASADGLSVYERLGFRQVALLRGYLRPEDTE